MKDPGNISGRGRGQSSVDSNGGAVWGWIAGIAIIILIVFVLVGGWIGSDTNKGSAKKSEAPLVSLSRIG